MATLSRGRRALERLVTRFGAALVCVRYRYGEKAGDNLTTAEIIVDRRPRLTIRYRDTEMAAIAVPYTETALLEMLKGAGIRRNGSGRSVLVRFGVTRHSWSGSCWSRRQTGGTMRADRTGRSVMRTYIATFCQGERDKTTYIGDRQVTYIRHCLRV